MPIDLVRLISPEVSPFCWFLGGPDFGTIKAQLTRGTHFLNPPLEGPACRVRSSEGPACQVRLSEGPACRVRCGTIDHPFCFSGHDKHAPPISHSDSTFGGTCLSGPTHDVG
jgi:hypothetical protein